MLAGSGAEALNMFLGYRGEQALDIHVGGFSHRGMGPSLLKWLPCCLFDGGYKIIVLLPSAGQLHTQPTAMEEEPFLKIVYPLCQLGQHFT